MREQKFRVWDKVDKRYYNNVDIEDIGRVLFLLNDYGHEYIIEQYTGLKDKNGKEIYEGDILGGIWESGFISWCEKCKQFQYHSAGIGCMACSGDVHWCEIVEDDGKLEVIGNIHENPELCGEEEE